MVATAATVVSVAVSHVRVRKAGVAERKNVKKGDQSRASEKKRKREGEKEAERYIGRNERETERPDI